MRVMKHVDFQISDLQTFLVVADLGNFSRAAEKLLLSQPTVTTRIARLESSLRIRLFNRTTRNVTLTAAGERLRQRAGHILANLVNLAQDLSDEAALKRASLRIGATPVVAACLLQGILRRLTIDYPGVAITLRDQHSDQCLKSLAAGELDVVFAPLDTDEPNFDFEPVYSSEFVLVVPRGHPLDRAEPASLAELASYPLLTLPSSASLIWKNVTREFERRGLAFRPYVEAYGAFTLVGLVEAGLGLTLVPSIMVPLLEHRKVGATRLRDLSAQHHVGIIRLRGHSLSPAALAFRKAVRQSFQVPREIKILPQGSTFR